MRPQELKHRIWKIWCSWVHLLWVWEHFWLCFSMIGTVLLHLLLPPPFPPCNTCVCEWEREREREECVNMVTSCCWLREHVIYGSPYPDWETSVSTHNHSLHLSLPSMSSSLAISTPSLLYLAPSLLGALPPLLYRPHHPTPPLPLILLFFPFPFNFVIC